jgi:hypothetical protein
MRLTIDCGDDVCLGRKSRETLCIKCYTKTVMWRNLMRVPLSFSIPDLMPSTNRFTDGDVTSFSRLLFDVARDQVIVGAR